MKYLLINSVFGVGSTGKIVKDLSNKLKDEGNQCLIAYGRKSNIEEEFNYIKIGNLLDCLFHGFISRGFDLHGFGSKHSTSVFLKKIEEFNPDVVWLHNLHGYYINVEMLFHWLKMHPKIKVYWTLHDCWPFTGHCSHFTIAKCDKWKKQCQNCPQKRTYPISYGCDNSKDNYKRKKEAFTGVNNLTLVAPSQWIADLTRESFLKDYPVKVVHNLIDSSVFCPTESEFRKYYNIGKKYIVLGVAMEWNISKGLEDMLMLRKMLNEKYIFVLVGLTKKQIRKLPGGIIGIERTSTQKQLAEIYTSADVFVNPTHQDNYPTVNLEAKACGTTVITYDVGGSAESVDKENVIKENDIAGLADRIKRICEK